MVIAGYYYFAYEYCVFESLKISNMYIKDYVIIHEIK
jgi:hypothetical protein